MKIAVILRQVPDVVEELVVAPDGRSLDEDAVMYITSEADEHALEQAILLKGRHGGTVAVLSVGGEEARDAAAKATAGGADEAILVPVPFESRGDNLCLAEQLTPVLKAGGFDLILTGVSAADQRDAGLAALLAGRLSLPYVGGLTSVAVEAGAQKATVHKEVPGGRLAVLAVNLPAVLGVQSAEQPPRYVPVSKVMQAKRSLQAKQLQEGTSEGGGVPVMKLMKPEAGLKAEMIAGDVNQVADQILRLLKERGLL